MISVLAKGSDVLIGLILVVIPIVVLATDEAVLLDHTNFDYFVTPNKTCLCMFYATWCPHCRHFQNAYDQIAKKLKGKMMVYKIDGDNCGTLKNRFNINKYPKIFLLKSGGHYQPEYYENKRDVETIVQWALNKATVQH